MRKPVTTLLISSFLLSSSIAYSQEYETITEDFDDNSRGWTVTDDENGMSYVKDGVYYISNKSKTNVKGFFCYQIIDPNADFSVEAKMTLKDGVTNNGYGLLLGFASWDNYANFKISGDGHVRISEKKNKETINTLEWKKEAEAVKGMGEANLLKIEKKGSEYYFYVNNTKVFTGTSLNYIGEKIGFKLDGTMSAEVDYIKITRKKITLDLIDNPINGYKLESLGPNINTKYDEYVPVISQNDNLLYIARKHPDNAGGEKDTDLWYSEKNEKGEWTPLIHAPKPLNNTGSNSVITITPDGNSLLLMNTYKEDGSSNGSGISISNKRNGEWQLPVEQKITNLKNVNAYANYFLSPDGTKLLLAIQNEKSYGDLDLYVSSFNENGTWDEPKNLGNVVNTFSSDFAPFLAADGKTLYFSSKGHQGYGSSDIFMSKRLDDTWENWSKPKNLGPEINSKNWDAYYCIPAKGDVAYMVSSDEKISVGGEDIFRIKLSESAKPDPVLLVKGKVFNKNTNEPINATIAYENLLTGKTEGTAFSTIENGFTIALPKGSNFGFRAEADGFIPVSENINLIDLANYTEKEINLYLVPIEKGQTVRLNNIFFDYDKSTLRTESYSELKRLIVFLNKNPETSIEIGGHTDNKGSDEYNLKLSTDRAKVVMQYLVDNGIDKNRVTSKGYGEMKPVTTNDTDEGREKNRRVEFIIL